MFPTPHRALLREHHCFLFSAVPFAKVSLAGGIAGKRSAGVVAAHCCTLTLEVLLCVSGWTVAKLFLDFSRLLTSMWLWRGCLESLSCVCFSFFEATSLLTSGGAMVARRCKAGKGVDFKVPVMSLHALFSSGSTFLAWHDRDQTGAQYSATE